MSQDGNRRFGSWSIVGCKILARICFWIADFIYLICAFEFQQIEKEFEEEEEKRKKEKRGKKKGGKGGDDEDQQDGGQKEQTKKEETKPVKKQPPKKEVKDKTKKKVRFVSHTKFGRF